MDELMIIIIHHHHRHIIIFTSESASMNVPAPIQDKEFLQRRSEK